MGMRMTPEEQLEMFGARLYDAIGGGHAGAASSGRGAVRGAIGGRPPEFWIFADDGESIMLDNPGAVLSGERATAGANGAMARLRPHSARSVRATARGRTGGETRNIRDLRAGRGPPSRRAGRDSHTRAGRDRFPGHRPPSHAQPPSRASSHLVWNRRANRPRRTGHVLIRRFGLTRRAGANGRCAIRFCARVPWSRPATGHGRRIARSALAGDGL
jgi:hypothetical protein